MQHARKVPYAAVLPRTILFTSEYMAYMYIYEYKYVYIYLYTLRRCGGLGVVSLPLGRPARVRISARGLPTMWSEGRQITL